jgi:hypothetical protein
VLPSVRPRPPDRASTRRLGDRIDQQPGSDDDLIQSRPPTRGRAWSHALARGVLGYHLKTICPVSYRLAFPGTQTQTGAQEGEQV